MSGKGDGWGPSLTTVGTAMAPFGHERLLLIDPGAPCRLFLDAGAGGRAESRLGEQSQIVAGKQQARASFDGKRRYRQVDANRLCRILAFVDAALPAPSADPAQPGTTFCVQTLPESSADTPAALEHWLTLEVMRAAPDNALLHHLRGLEAYHLITYLLQPGDHDSLNELCVRYGLSYSHFRRLCSRALGSSVKPRLREWRGARAMLDLITGQLPVLEVALEHGYASASHISSDLKQLFGITPRMAKNAQSLLP